MTSPADHNIRLLLVRHAHAAWAQPGMRDFDRPLDMRGREEAARLAAALAEGRIAPEVIVCSNARRCAETLAIILERLPGHPRIIRTDELYTASHETYLDIISEYALSDCPSLMIVGHNPMIENTAHALLRNDPEMAAGAIGGGFPTAGLMVIDCPTGPAGLGIGDGQIFSLTRRAAN